MRPTPAARKRTVAWAKDDPFGVEFAEIEIGADRLAARGVAIGSSPFPHRLDYQLETGPAFVSSRAEVLPGVRLLPTPGHTRGHQSVLIDTPDGFVAIDAEFSFSRCSKPRYTAEVLSSTTAPCGGSRALSCRQTRIPVHPP